MSDIALEVELTFDEAAAVGTRTAAAAAVEGALGRLITTRDWRVTPDGYTFTIVSPGAVQSLIPPLLARARLAAQREVPSATMRLRNVDPRVAEVA